MQACPSVDPLEQPEYRDLTDEEREIYNKIMDESEGFDAWQCPENITEMGLIKTLLVSKEESPDEYEKFNQLSQFTVDQYNDQQGTNFQFVKVLKANVEFSGSCIYYLTFQAEDTASGAFENFQARVILHYTLERKVALVRLEPKNSQSVQGE